MGDRAFQPTEPPRRRAARANFLALLGFVGLAALVPAARAGWGVTGPIAPALLARMWTAEMLLCPLTGLAAWLVWRRIDVGLERKRAALRRWGWLLMLSALWPAMLRAADSPALASVTLLCCLAVACVTVFAFRRLRPGAALLLLPYTVWVGVMAAIATARF